MSALAVLAVVAAAAFVRTRLTAGRSPRTSSLARHRPTPRSAGHDTDTSAWAQLLGDTAAAVRAGASLGSALDDALATTPVQGALVRPGAPPWAAQRSGADARVRCGPDERLVVAVLCAAHRVGGRTAPALDGAAAVLRERVARRAEARVQASSARASARLLTLLPLVVALWSALASPAVRTALTSPTGLSVTVVGVATNLVGRWWMHRLVLATAP